MSPFGKTRRQYTCKYKDKDCFINVVFYYNFGNETDNEKILQGQFYSISNHRLV